MIFGVLGRRGALIKSAEALMGVGHMLKFVQTSKSEDHYDLGPDDFESLATNNSADFKYSSKLDKNDLLGLDFVISHNWPYIISRQFLDAPKFGILNAHPGDLPRYRGNACLNWAILNFETNVALTIHKMDSGLDTGPILFKSYRSLTNKTNITELYDWLDHQMPIDFNAAVSRLSAQGDSAFKHQNKKVVPLRCYPRTPKDSEIDWSLSALKIQALIRASTHPFKGAYTFDSEQTLLRIHSAEITQCDFEYLSIPGSILEADSIGLKVSTGNGILYLTSISTETLNHQESCIFYSKRMRTRFHGK
jgi:UDP-4-amino-4-deoxy-L-arabinose formyltransferase/UDP-glucuronic acid dehydrogenase (UDP-4-keto-hexauronic acid decarboxylating)